MKTTLTPPPITPGPWAVSPTVKYAARWVQDPKGWDVASVTQHQTGDYDVVAKFIAAAPAMAEALAALVSTYGMPDSGSFGPEEPIWEAARHSLISAGYTFTTDADPQP